MMLKTTRKLLSQIEVSDDSLTQWMRETPHFTKEITSLLKNEELGPVECGRAIPLIIRLRDAVPWRDVHEIIIMYLQSDSIEIRSASARAAITVLLQGKTYAGDSDRQQSLYSISLYLRETIERGLSIPRDADTIRNYLKEAGY